MASKKRCRQCRDYFIDTGVFPAIWCSDECKNEAMAEDREKKYKKTQERLEKQVEKVKKKRKVKSPFRLAKEDAWDQFSIYIRTRDCIRFTGKPDEGMCVTCKRPYPFKKLQAGHFIQGRGNAVLFDERIVYTQCLGCNGNPPYGKGGNYVEYFVFMEEEWGREMIEEFRNLRHKNVKYNIVDLREIKVLYSEKTQALLANL